MFAPALKAADQTLTKPAGPIVESRISQRVASIDWMRGLVMIFMVIDHASMAFDAHHLDHDSAMYADGGTMALGGGILHALAHAPVCAGVRVSHGYVPAPQRRAAGSQGCQRLGD